MDNDDWVGVCGDEDDVVNVDVGDRWVESDDRVVDSLNVDDSVVGIDVNDD